jgi:serine/threonine-protein kinase
MTMYHLLTGRDPEVLAEDPKPIRQYEPALSAGLEKIVSKCVEQDPKKRFQNCDALLKALNEELQPKRFRLFGK